MSGDGSTNIATAGAGGTATATTSGSIITVPIQFSVTSSRPLAGADTGLTALSLTSPPLTSAPSSALSMDISSRPGYGSSFPVTMSGAGSGSGGFGMSSFPHHLHSGMIESKLTLHDIMQPCVLDKDVNAHIYEPVHERFRIDMAKGMPSICQCLELLEDVLGRVINHVSQTSHYICDADIRNLTKLVSLQLFRLWLYKRIEKVSVVGATATDASTPTTEQSETMMDAQVIISVISETDKLIDRLINPATDTQVYALRFMESRRAGHMPTSLPAMTIHPGHNTSLVSGALASANAHNTASSGGDGSTPSTVKQQQQRKTFGQRMAAWCNGGCCSSDDFEKDPP